MNILQQLSKVQGCTSVVIRFNNISPPSGFMPTLSITKIKYRGMKSFSESE